ncbi:MAG: hypothetical protein AAF567_24850 [Actinomycetota bacterium]
MNVHKATRIGGLIAVIWCAQIALGYVDAVGLGALSGGLFLIGVVVFYGWHSSGISMRGTITATFVAVYMALLAAFLTSDRTRMQIEDDVGLQVWQGFSWLVGAIVISYFGASVASEAIDAFGNRDETGFDGDSSSEKPENKTAD